MAGKTGAGQHFPDLSQEWTADEDIELARPPCPPGSLEDAALCQNHADKDAGIQDRPHLLPLSNGADFFFDESFQVA